MNREIRATEELAREVIGGQFMEIAGYINPTQDNFLSAWMMALDRAQRMVGTIQTVCDAIAARPLVTVQFTEIVAEDLNPAEDLAMDEIEARAAKAVVAWNPFYHPVFADALKTVQPRREAV